MQPHTFILGFGTLVTFGEAAKAFPSKLSTLMMPGINYEIVDM